MYIEALERARRNLEAFHTAIEDPVFAQDMIQGKLVEDYLETDYGEGKECGSLEEYRKQFPIVSYPDLEPWFERVRNENYKRFLSEEPQGNQKLFQSQPSIWIIL